MRFCCHWALICAITLSCQSDVFAQQQFTNGPTRAIEATQAPAETDPKFESANELRSKRQEVAEMLRVTQQALDAEIQSAEQNNSNLPNRLQREVELLKQLAAVIAQRESANADRNELQTRLNDLKSQIETIRESGPPEKQPYSFLLLDQLKDELNVQQSRVETDEAAAIGATEAVVRARTSLESKQQAQRKAKDAAISKGSEANRVATAHATDLAQLEVRVDMEALALEKQEQDNQQLVAKLHHTSVVLLKEKIKSISKTIEFSDRDLQDRILKFDKDEEDLRSELQLAESNLQYAEGEWSQAQHEIDNAKDKSLELVEKVEEKNLARQRFQTQVSSLNARIERLAVNRTIWQRRFNVARQIAKTEELITWGDEGRTRLDQLERDQRLEQMQIDELRQEVAGRDQKIQNTSQDTIRRLIEKQRDTLNHMMQIRDANIVSIQSSARLVEKLLAEINSDVKKWTFNDWIESCQYYAKKIWYMELASVDDHPLTIGKVLVGMLLVFISFVLARMLSRTLGYRLQHGRIRMNESGAAALQSLSFYVLLACFILTALKYVNVPLTMFTFLGGAIAIGVGFGSQNILNNFISGLILLAERPIKVGDLIQLDGLYGTVEHIGARSTRIHTGDNLDIIVPNSKFLESNVVNLTLGNNKLRTHISVGVVYGSPTRDVTRLLKHAAMEHGCVLKHPEPFIWFSDFGDSALTFELHFWVEVRTVTERRRIESDLRYRIDQLFREAGLVIAFPQRDIHLDTKRPIDVCLLPSRSHADDAISDEVASKDDPAEH